MSLKIYSGIVPTYTYIDYAYKRNLFVSSPKEKHIHRVDKVVTEQLSRSFRETQIRTDSVRPFSTQEFLHVFPYTMEDAQRLFTKARSALTSGIRKLLKIKPEERTFNNTVMAYHDLMVAFDAKERLVRSERCLGDDVVGKQELLNQFVQHKEKLFAYKPLLNSFISYAKRMVDEENGLLPVEWHCLKGVIHTIQEQHVSRELVDVLKQIKNDLQVHQDVPFVYLQGDCDSKQVKHAAQKAFSFATANLCIMPEELSMIHGGLLPWRTRIDSISNKLNSLNCDCIFLQEIYDIRAIFALHKLMSSSYTHFYGNFTPKVCGFTHQSLHSSSGLGVISRLKLTVDFEPYKVVTNEKKISDFDFDRLKMFGFDRNYGLLHCVVKDGRKTLAHVTSTHENPFFVDIRHKQTEQAVTAIQEKATMHPKDPLFFVGDLNIEKGDMTEGAEHLVQKHFVDVYQGSTTCIDFNDYWHRDRRDVGSFVKSKHTPWTVDRSLLWRPWAKAKNYSMLVERVLMNDVQKPEEALSDHHAIVTYFKAE